MRELIKLIEDWKEYVSPNVFSLNESENDRLRADYFAKLDQIKSLLQSRPKTVSMQEARRVWDEIACPHCENIMPDDFVKWLQDHGIEVIEEEK